MTMRWNRSMCVPMACATAALIGVGVGHAHDDAAGVSGARAIDRGDHSGLHLGEALAVGEAERRRCSLHRVPLRQLHQLLQFSPVQSPKSHSSSPLSMWTLQLDAPCRSVPRSRGPARAATRRWRRPASSAAIRSAAACAWADRRRRGAGPAPGRAALAGRRGLSMTYQQEQRRRCGVHAFGSQPSVVGRVPP